MATLAARLLRCLGAKAAVRGLAALCFLLGLWLAPAAAAPLPLDERQPSHDLWPAVEMLEDESAALTLPQVLARERDFRPAAGPRANLGKRRGAVWLRVPLRAGAGGAPWVLDIDYPSLDGIEVYLLDGGRIEQAARLGDERPAAQRAPATRAPAVALALPAGAERLLLVRVQTSGTMIVPLVLRSPADHLGKESAEQALQGLLAGMGLCLLLYSLAQWAMLRDAMFAWYALALSGSTAFFAAMSGMGSLYLWGGSDWLSRHAPPFFILPGIAGSMLFALRALEVQRLSPRIATVLRLGAGVALGTAALFAAGVLDYATTQSVGTAMGPTPLLLVLPVVWRRLREGDAAARFMLAGWGFYGIGSLIIVGLLRGWMPADFWTTHAFQFGSLFEMAMWMLVLGERVQAIRRHAMVLSHDRDRLRSLALTDALTGLPNRRGLQEALTPLLVQATPRSPLALYLIDLDGFKPVNDTLGHDAGDALLVAVGQRLRQQLRGLDIVARLGGDEFVVVVGGLGGDDDAVQVGRKLLRAFEAPFEVAGRPCRVGLTIGYALSPQDDRDLAGLLRRADAAMYAGKKAGKHCLMRGGAQAAMSAA